MEVGDEAGARGHPSVRASDQRGTGSQGCPPWYPGREGNEAVRAISPRTSVQLIASFGIALVMTAFILAFADSEFIEVMTLPGAIAYGVAATLAPWWILRWSVNFDRAVFAYAAVMAATGFVVLGVRAATDVRTWDGSSFPLVSCALISLFGALFGGLSSLVFVLPVGRAFLHCAKPTRDAAARMTQFVGVGLLGHGLFIHFLLGRPRLTPHAELAGVMLIALAVVVLTGSTVRRVQWSLWRSRILAHRDPTWFAVPIASTTTNVDSLPALTRRDHEADGVILRRSPGPPSGAYRTGENVEPYALVRLPDDFEPEQSTAPLVLVLDEGTGAGRRRRSPPHRTEAC